VVEFAAGLDPSLCPRSSLSGVANGVIYVPCCLALILASVLGSVYVMYMSRTAIGLALWCPVLLVRRDQMRPVILYSLYLCLCKRLSMSFNLMYSERSRMMRLHFLLHQRSPSPWKTEQEFPFILRKSHPSEPLLRCFVSFWPYAPTCTGLGG
jgi:hypothetical protein